MKEGRNKEGRGEKKDRRKRLEKEKWVKERKKKRCTFIYHLGPKPGWGTSLGHIT